MMDHQEPPQAQQQQQQPQSVTINDLAVIIEQERKRLTRYSIVGCVLLTLCVVSIIVAVIVLNSNDSENSSNNSINGTNNVTKPSGTSVSLSPSTSSTSIQTSSPTIYILPMLVYSLATKGVSVLENLQNEESPQGLAVNWIVYDRFGDSGGDNWDICNRFDNRCESNGVVNGWLTDTSECSWYGIQCNEYELVISIEFPEATQEEIFQQRLTPLKGNIPSEIGLLKKIERLIISNMDIHGPILDYLYLNQTSNLYHLELTKCNFTGTISDTFSIEYPNIRYLNLENNSFVGELPKSLEDAKQLYTLILKNNQFSGQIPSELGTISNLEIINLEYNRFSGSIPIELYQPQYTIWRFTGNPLYGNIHNSIGRMKNLTELSLGVSNMFGTIPSTMFHLTSLLEFDLHNASFTGKLSDVGFSNLTQLQRFEVQNNNFIGPIPIFAISNMTNLERLQLQGNDQLTGTIPQSICNLRGTDPYDLQVLVVGCNISAFYDCADINFECQGIRVNRK